MQIKKFEAKTMAEALGKVKQEFGPEAVILSARSVKKEHGVLGALWTPKVEVTAAKDSIVAHRNKAEQATGTYSRTGSTRSHLQPPVKQRFERSDRVQLHSPRMPVNRAEPKLAARETIAGAAAEQASFERRLLQAGVDKALAAQVWQTSTAVLGAQGVGNANKSEACLLQACLEEQQLVAGGLSFGDNRQKIVALVGASGVGKTTTLAKIASQHSCLHKRRVAFISLDYYRIAANAELQVYSRLLDVPLAVVSNPSAFKDALTDFKEYDLILIDTPGFIPDQPEYLNVMSLLTSNSGAMDFYLLLSAPTREQELLLTIKKLDLLPLTGLIFTKLDECQTCGHLLNLLMRTRVPAAFVTHGHRVPEDIEPLSCERLSQLIVKYADESMLSETPLADSGAAGVRVAAETARTWSYVANKKTDLYHSPLCESAKRIKTINIAYFKTREAAEKERYQPCRLCIPSQSEHEALPAQYAV